MLSLGGIGGGSQLLHGLQRHHTGKFGNLPRIRPRHLQAEDALHQAPAHEDPSQKGDRVARTVAPALGDDAHPLAPLQTALAVTVHPADAVPDADQLVGRLEGVVSHHRAPAAAAVFGLKSRKKGLERGQPVLL